MLIPVHPRKVYYHLSTCPPLPIDHSDSASILVNGRVTPSASSVEPESIEEGSDDNNSTVHGLRLERSPSPEVDLSSPDFDYELSGPTGASDGSSKPAPEFPADQHHNHRQAHAHAAMRSRCTASPPLERDEREFTQTASAVRERASEALSAQLAEEPGTAGRNPVINGSMEGGAVAQIINSAMEESVVGGDADMLSGEEGRYADFYSHSKRDQAPMDLDDAATVALFDTSPSPSLSSTASSVSTNDDSITTVSSSAIFGGPPSVNKEEENMVANSKHIGLLVDMLGGSWRELQSPETVEVAELDEMFGEF